MFVPVLISPLSKDGTPDTESLVSLVSYLENIRPHNRYWLFGTGGEDFALSFEYRLLFLKELAHSSYDLNQFIVGLGNLPFADSMRLCKEASKLGFNQYHFVQPMRAVSIESVFRHLNILAQTFTRESFWGYFSDNYSRQLCFKDLLDLKESGYLNRLKGIKYSTSDVESLSKSKSILDSLEILPAKAMQLLLTLQHGYENSTSIEACIHLEILNSIINHYNRGEISAASDLHGQFASLSSFMRTSASKHNFMNIAEIKYMLYKKEVIKYPTVSLDLCPLSEDDTIKLDSSIKLL